MPIRVSFLPRVLVLFCVFSFFSFHLSAQTPDTAVVRGSVVDQSHAVVAGADITISNQHTGLKRTAQTDASGKFSVSGLPIGGEYEISAQKQGFALATSNVTVIGGATAEMNFQLSPAAEKTEILVTGAVGEVRTDLPQIGRPAGHVTDRGDAAPQSPHHLSANAQRGESPGHQPGRRFMNQNLFTTNGTGRRQGDFNDRAILNGAMVDRNSAANRVSPISISVS